MRPARFLAALASAALTATLAGASTAQAIPPEEHVCFWEGADQNELLGIDERVIGPPPCREAFAGERWVRIGPGWSTASAGERKVYPQGYVPQDPDPIDDFNAKFQGARYVLDRGTAQERTFVYGREVLRTGFVAPDGRPFSIPASPPFEPLSVGGHTVITFLRFSAEHCDGLGRNRDQNCVPAGELPWTGDTPLTVFPRSA